LGRSNETLKHLLTLLALLLCAPSAWAAEADWIEGCDEDSTTRALTTVNVTLSLAPGERACAESITATDVTDELNVGRCDEVDIFQYIDPDGAADDSTVTGQVEICPSVIDDDDSCDDFGITAFTGDTFLAGLGATYIRVAAAGTTDTAEVRWEVRCSGPSR